jgi:hypothetical protein
MDDVFGQAQFHFRYSSLLTARNITIIRCNNSPVTSHDEWGIYVIGAEDALLENIIIDGGNNGLALGAGFNGHYDETNQMITLSNAVIKNNDYQHPPMFTFNRRIGNAIWAIDSRLHRPNQRPLADIRIVNSTIINNLGIDGVVEGSRANLWFFNSIIHGNHPFNRIHYGFELESSYSGDLYLSHNIIEGFPGSVIIFRGSLMLNIGNLNVDPLLDANGFLRAGSQAIGTGTLNIPNYTFPEFDLAGNPRINNGNISMGAYEFYGSPIVVEFNGTPLSGPAPLTVQFSDHSFGGEIFAWEWDFDFDGIIDSTEQHPTHTYTEAGTYTVALIVNNGEAYTIKGSYITITVSGIDDIEDLFVTKLEGCYPNPFNPETTISFTLNQFSNVVIDIFNIKGQKVKTLIDDHFERGSHKVVWDGKDGSGNSASSGLYFYRMATPEYSAVKKMILMK